MLKEEKKIRSYQSEFEGDESLEPEFDDINSIDATNPNNGNNNPEDIYPLENIKIEKEQLSVYELKRKYDRDKDKENGNKSIQLDPDFQRERVWEPIQKRELIESILMGIPLPLFYFAEDKNGSLIVVDGRQRLSTLFDFLDNKFQLANLKILKAFNSKYFKELLPKDQAKIEDYQLQINVIKPPTPERIKFDIFERVNRDGTKLNKQEMRNALYQGPATKLLNKLSINQTFKNITNNTIKPKRMKDKYVILRFVSFYMWKENLLKNGKLEKIEYKSDIDDFLGQVMEFLNKQSLSSLNKIETLFCKTISNIEVVFDHNGLRLPSKTEYKRPINMYLFESIFYLFSKLKYNEAISKKNEIKDYLNDLLGKDQSDFYKSLTHSTDSSTSVKTRFNEMTKLINKLK